MPDVLIRFTVDAGAPGSGLSNFNAIYQAQIGSGVLIADLLDSQGNPTGLSIREGATPFASAISSLTLTEAETSPDPQVPLDAFRGAFAAGGSGEKFIISGFAPGQPYTLKLGGQNANARSTIFSATNSDPATATFAVDSDSTTLSAPVTLTGTANNSGEIAISATLVSIHPYCSFIVLSYTASGQPTAAVTISGDLTPGATVTCQITGFASNPTEIALVQGTITRTASLTHVSGNDYTFQMPALPAVGGTAQLFKVGQVTARVQGAV